VYIATTDPKGPMRYSPIIGYRHYVHCSALGKSLIAPLPDAAIVKILKSRGMPALSPNTITSPQKLVSDICLVRERGYAIDNEEGAVGVCCIAVPLYNHQGQVIAAISLSGISPYFTEQTIPQIVANLQDGAGEISRQLGWRGA
jgi:DNA-binding IclR family transcriptional regulator